MAFHSDTLTPDSGLISLVRRCHSGKEEALSQVASSDILKNEAKCDKDSKIHLI